MGIKSRKLLDTLNQSSVAFSYCIKHLMNMTTFDDRPSRQMLFPSIFFLILGMGIGLFLAISTFLFPNVINEPLLQFGRLRPVHVNAIAWLWLLSANMGLFYFIVPRLAGVPLWSIKLAYVTNILWWIVLCLGVFSLPFGYNWGWEYAELPMWLFGWLPIKGLIAFIWVLFSLNLTMTVVRRHYKKIYVALWYGLGTLFWTAITFIAGNLVMDWVPGGVARVNVNFFYVHNLVGLIFTPMGLAIAYYFIPKISDTPLYSHRLSMIGFWSVAFVYAWVGAHHMIHGPISQWLQTTSIIFSIWLFIPVWTVVTNFFGTLKVRWKEGLKSIPLRFFAAGTLFYLVTCIQGPLQSLRSVNAITSKTDWIIGHAHLALFGSFSFFAFGGIYGALMIMYKRPMHSESLSKWHFHCNFWGALLMFFSLMLGGYWQGLMWNSWGQGDSYPVMQAQFGALSFLDTLAKMFPFWVARAISGVIILFGNCLFVYNVWMTVRKRSEESAVA